MSTTIELTAAPPQDWIPAQLYQMTVDKYEALVESGVFTRCDKFHLINGFLVKKMTKNPPHSVALYNARVTLERVVAGRPLHVRVEEPVRLPPNSEPEPDVALTRGANGDYIRRHPGPADVALLVEVAFSSVLEDRHLASVYAAAMIPVYWLVNLVDRQVEVYTHPAGRGYAQVDLYHPGTLVPVVVDGELIGEIAVDDLLP